MVDYWLSFARFVAGPWWPQPISDLVSAVSDIMTAHLMRFFYFVVGITGTYLGDHCGVLMDAPVVGFPFSMLDNPMYDGAVLNYLALGLWQSSFVGVVMAFWVFCVYRVAIFFEGPFTSYIYGEAARLKELEDEKVE